MPSWEVFVSVNFFIIKLPKLSTFGVEYRVSQKKRYGVADHRYFKNVNHINVIFSDIHCNKYNLSLVVCEVSTSYVKRN